MVIVTISPLFLFLWLFFVLLGFFLAFLCLLLFGFRHALCFFHFQLAAEELDDRQIGSIAFAVTELDDPAVATVAISEPRSDCIEYFFRNGFAQEIRLNLTACMKVIPLA